MLKRSRARTTRASTVGTRRPRARTTISTRAIKTKRSITAKGQRARARHLQVLKLERLEDLELKCP